jgi:hypothetical protein
MLLFQFFSIYSFAGGSFAELHPFDFSGNYILVVHDGPHHLRVADGSEILDYDGDLSREFEWARYLGTANNPEQGEGDDPATSLHEMRVPYIDTPPVMTYEILQNIVRILKEEGERAYPSRR